MQTPIPDQSTQVLKQRYSGLHPGTLALAYVLTVIFWTTLMPFDFRPGSPQIVLVMPDLFDLVGNIIMFLPVGFFVGWRSRAGIRRSLLEATLIGLLASGSIETAQMWLPSRFTGPSDLLTNILGSVLGCLVYAGISRFSERRISGGLLLDLPMVVFLYLLTPLMWLAAVTAIIFGGYLIKALVLALASAWIIAAVWHYRLAGQMPAWVLAVLWLLWLGVALMPLVFLNDYLYFGGLGALLLTAISRGLYLRMAQRTERRFEAATLFWVWPCFALYLLALPFPDGLPRSWNADLAFSLGLPFDRLGRWQALALLEHIAAFAVLGFLLGQTRGRRDDDSRMPLLVATLIAIGISIAIEALHGFQFGNRASGLRCLLGAGSAAYGVALYRTQVRWVRHLLSPGMRARGHTLSG